MFRESVSAQNAGPDAQPGLMRDSLFSFRSPKGYFPMLFTNFKEQAVAPFRMSQKQVVRLMAGTGVLAAMIYFDGDIDRYFRPVKSRNHLIREVSQEYTELGDYYGLSLLGVYGVYGLAAHKSKGFETALLASQASICAGTWTRAFKMLTARMRPGATYGDAEYPEGNWFGPFGQFNSKNNPRGIAAFDAFPSGHTSIAFSLATVFAKQYEDEKIVPVIAYTLATLVGLSRMVEHEHWASDVFAGAVLGYWCGNEVVQHYRKLFPMHDGNVSLRKNNFREYHLFPFAGRAGAGMQFTCIF